MTVYDDYDRSLDSGKPAELFQFSGGIMAHYTTKQRSITYQGYEYKPDFIAHGDIEQSEELNKQELEITLKSNSSVAQLYISDVPAQSVNLRVFRFIDGINEFRLIWAGRVVKINFDSEMDTCVVHCEPIFTMLKRPGLRRNYQILCPFVLYGSNCRLSIAPYTFNERVTSVSGVTITGLNISVKGNGYFTGGFIRFGVYYKLIINHDAGKITLASPIPGLKNGDLVDLTAGCDKSIRTCTNKFHNHLNFGGFPFIPTKNIFNGDSLFGG